MSMELLQSNVTPGTTPESDPQLDAVYRTLDRVIGSVSMADNKALIALTFQGAIIAGLALVVEPISRALSRHGGGMPRIAMIILLLTFFGLLGVSTLKLLQTISPRIRHQAGNDHPSALFYFGGIASMSPEKFAARMRELNPDDVHQGISTITYANAAIAFQKFANLRHAYVGLGLQMVTYVLILVLAIILISG
jgi:hypothetical protein